MIDIDDVIKEVAKRTKIDKDVVSIVCKNAFEYTTLVMKEDDDTKDILFNQLFKFKLKRRYKENKTQNYSSK